MLLWTESFDASLTAAALITQYETASWSAGSTFVRTGVRSAQAGGLAWAATKWLTFSGDGIQGTAYFSNSFDAIKGIVSFVDTDHSTDHLTVTINTSGFLEVRRGGIAGTVLATGTTLLVVGTWYYIEFKCNIHDSTGSYTLKIDGVSELTASGVDTRNGANGVLGAVRFGYGSASANSWHDDWYVCDTSGSLNNDFLGSVKIECVLPVTDAVAPGTNAGLTCSTGTDHGALVDETTPNDTDFNSSSTVGLKDTYNFPALSLTGAIKGTHLKLYGKKTDTGDRKFTPVTRSGGTDYDGTPKALTSVPAYTITEIREVDPATSVAWLAAGVDAAEFGAKVAGA